jgi:murein DD-endopeptidase MepM/ murein hydrolase activator NlpD
MVVVLAIWRGARIFLSESVLTATHVLEASLVLSCVVSLVREYRFPGITSRHSCIKWLTPVIMVMLGFLLNGYVFYLRSMPADKKKAIKTVVPFKGKWRVITGGRFEFMNYHYNNPDTQNYAVDFVKTGPDDASRGQKIYAPVGGLVVKAVGNRKEGIYDPPEGNIVIIQTENHTDVWLVHLQEGSVKVKAGDMVEAGQEIASCGASGGADLPHLHIHAERNGKPVPLLMGRGALFPVRGDVISDKD